MKGVLDAPLEPPVPLEPLALAAEALAPVPVAEAEALEAVDAAEDSTLKPEAELEAAEPALETAFAQ